MHRAKRLNTCSESSAFDFHSRMKSTFLSFSRLPILYHRRREFDGWKTPLSRLSCCYSRTQHTAASMFLHMAVMAVAVARRSRLFALSSFILFTLVYFTLTLLLFRYDWVDQNTGGTIFHHQKSIFAVLESRAAIRRTANFTFKGFFKVKVPYYSNSSASFAIARILLAGDVELNPGMTVTTNPDERRNTKASKRGEENITIAHLNARSIKNRNHFILLKDVVRANKFDVLTVSETWLDSSVSNFEIEIPGYSIFRLDRLDKVGAGVCAFVKHNLKVELLSELSFIGESDQAGNCKSFLICTAYRPPSTSTDCFDAEFGDAVISAMSLSKPIYILGDLNCNLLKSSDPASQALLNFCTSFNLTQMIAEPTRVTKSSATLIDVILASNKNLVRAAKVIPVSISDHDLVYAVLKLNRQRPKPTFITTRSFKKYQHEAFLRNISLIPWSVVDFFDEVNDSLHAFNLLFNEVLDEHAPVRTIKLRG